jgi:hypothetical protein
MRDRSHPSSAFGFFVFRIKNHVIKNPEKLMFKQSWLFIVLLEVFLFFGACGVRNPAEDWHSIPLILDITTPVRISLSTASIHSVYVAVEDPQGLQDIDRVSFTMSSTQDAILMSDRGRDGDLLPGDGVYSGQFTESLFTAAGDYQLAVSVKDLAGNTVTELSDTIHVLEMRIDEPPVLNDALVADTLKSEDLQTFHISIHADHAQGSEAVDSLIFQIYPPLSPAPLFQGIMTDDGTGGDETTGDGVFSRTIDLSDTLSSVGMHEIRFQAWDTAGGMSLPVVEAFFIIGIGDFPVLSDVNAPSVVNRIDPSPYIITIRVSDKQGLSDIKRVYFNSVKPDGKPASGNPFIMLDDGGQASGDAQAGDGVYAITISITSRNALGKYSFTFYAEDFEGHISDPLIHELTVIQGDFN